MWLPEATLSIFVIGSPRAAAGNGKQEYRRPALTTVKEASGPVLPDARRRTYVPVGSERYSHHTRASCITCDFRGSGLTYAMAYVIQEAWRNGT